MPEPAPPPLDAVMSRPQRGPRSIVDLALHRDPDAPALDGGRLEPPRLKARLWRRVTSCPVPVPRGDWEKVVVGAKPMFRTYAGWRNHQGPLFEDGEEFPRPAVLYSYAQTRPRHVNRALGVILAYRQEPLGAISVEDINREGFDTVKDFRRYWRRRYPTVGWRPTDLISVVELRPWQPDDNQQQAEWLLEQLYGEWL